MGIIVNQKRLDKQGLDTVLHDTTLSGDGNTENPLSVIEQKVTLTDNESDNLPLLNDETVSQKFQEFYNLNKWLKNHMISRTNYWPNILFSDIKNGDKLSWAGQANGYNIAPLTEYDRNGWEVITDNSQQGGAGAEGIYRLIYNSDTDWFVEGKSWHQENFSIMLQYSPNSPGYEQFDTFDGNGGIVSINGDLSNSSIARVLGAELEFLNIDFRGLLDIVCNTISNQTIGGIKTFKYSPQVPAPYNDNDSSPKWYVDTKYSKPSSGIPNSDLEAPLEIGTTENDAMAGNKTAKDLRGLEASDKGESSSRILTTGDTFKVLQITTSGDVNEINLTLPTDSSNPIRTEYTGDPIAFDIPLANINGVDTSVHVTTSQTNTSTMTLTYSLTTPFTKMNFSAYAALNLPLQPLQLVTGPFNQSALTSSNIQIRIARKGTLTVWISEENDWMQYHTYLGHIWSRTIDIEYGGGGSMDLPWLVTIMFPYTLPIITLPF